MTEEAEGIGARIKRLRLAAGLTQTAIAGPGATTSYVSLLESGKRRPTLAALRAIAVRLGVPMSELLGDLVVPREEVARFRAPFPMDAMEDLARIMQRAYGLDVTIAFRDGWFVADRIGEETAAEEYVPPGVGLGRGMGRPAPASTGGEV